MANKKVSATEAALAAKALEKLLSAQTISKKHIYIQNFLRGLFFSIGGIIGATVGIALILWVLSFFSQVPLIGEFATKVESTISTYKP
jgi:hypothetical protein